MESISGKTAFNYFKDEGITAGWNLGNSLDSFRNGVGSETIWGNPSINQEILNGVKAAGFDIIRIPITWMGHIGGAPDYRVSEDRLRRAAEVVDMAYNAGLKVIINLHHDGSTSSLEQEEGWLSIGKSYKDENEYNRITLQFTRLWEQIAAYFQNYGDWLIFEPMNEIHDGGWCWSGEFRSNPARQTSIVNKWNQIFTDVVRASGGNNPQRYLVIPAYCTNPQQTLSPLFILPNDSAADKQIVTFHYYDPWEFGIQGSRYAWGTPADKQKTIDDFAPFKTRYIDNNIPVIIGECGAVLQLYPGDPDKQAQARQSRFEYIAHVFAAARNFSLVPMYWDNGATTGSGEKFGLLDRRTGLPNSEDSAALINLMVNGAGL
uniref:Glycoside hydrolase family 5 n=1 Tax=uncultured bacterium contig00002 TaxID=1181494 RepID=A0A806JYC6_9BACT|nr:glycoside hydrolase family 5 [uncultured bacterium contig00002]